MASSAILPFAQLLMDRGAANSPDNRANQAVMLTDMILKNQATQQALEAGKAKAAKDRQATKDAKDVLNTKLALIARIERDKSALLQSGYKGPLPMPSEGKTLAQLDDDALMVDKAKMEAGQRKNLAGSLEDDTQRKLAGPIAAFAGLGGTTGLRGFDNEPLPIDAMTQIRDDVMVPNALSRAIGPEMTDFYRGEIENAPSSQLDSIGRDLRKDFATKSKPGADPLKDLFEVKATVDSGGNLVRYTEIGGVIPPHINGPALIQYIDDLKRKSGRGGAAPSTTTQPSQLVTNENLIADKPVWAPEEEEAAKQWDAYFAGTKTSGPDDIPLLPPNVPQPKGYVEPTGISFQVDTGKITPEQREADKAADKKDTRREKANALIAAVKSVDTTDGNSLMNGIKSIEMLLREPYLNILTQSEKKALASYKNGYAAKRRKLQDKKAAKEDGATKDTGPQDRAKIEIESKIKTLQAQKAIILKAYEANPAVGKAGKAVYIPSLKAMKSLSQVDAELEKQRKLLATYKGGETTTTAPVSKPVPKKGGSLDGAF